MIDIRTPLSEKELDQLADFLESVKSDTAMSIEECDGFFCALVVGPELVMPSEYWPHVLGGGPSELTAFKTQEQAEDIMSLLTRHWNTIVGTLRDGDLYVPVMFEDEDGITRGNEWAIGFLRGVDLRRESWEEFLADEEHSAAIIPMFALAHENHPDPELRYDSPSPEKREELIAFMAGELMKMYAHFQEARGDGSSHEPVMRSTPKIGRNEPCPCGSGKKYKHCCGSQVH